jgi:hypothetical protein
MPSRPAEDVYGQVGATSSQTTWKMPGYNLEEARPAFPSHGGLQTNTTPPPQSDTGYQPKRSKHLRVQLPEIHPTIPESTPPVIVSGTVYHSQHCVSNAGTV